MKVILLYLVLEKLVFGAFQNVGSTTVFFLVYTAFSKSFCDCYAMVFKVKFHRAFGIGRKRKQCCVSHKRVLREQNLGFVTGSFIRTQQKEIAQRHLQRCEIGTCSLPRFKIYVLCWNDEGCRKWSHIQCTVFIFNETTLQYCWQIGPKHDIQ